jgi:hypothetical protein
VSNTISTEYIPGSCNIGKAEIRQRQVVALFGLGFAVASGFGLLAADAPSAARWAVFMPLMVWAIGYMQARQRFCLAYGLLGTFNFERLGKMNRVVDPALRRLDRIAALQLMAKAAALAAVVTAAFVFMPL